jgi:hypothetical protein
MSERMVATHKISSGYILKKQRESWWPKKREEPSVKEKDRPEVVEDVE